MLCARECTRRGKPCTGTSVVLTMRGLAVCERETRERERERKRRREREEEEEEKDIGKKEQHKNSFLFIFVINHQAIFLQLKN